MRNIDKPITLQKLVGHNLHEFRLNNGYTLDTVATASQKFGTKWNASYIKKIESGLVPITLETAIILTSTLSSLDRSSDFSLLIEPDKDYKEKIKILNTFILSAETIAEIFAGESIKENIAPDYFDSTNSRTLNINRPATLAEQRAAKKLHIDEYTLIITCEEIYGLPINEEATRRAGKGASAQKRGHETRLLIEEIRKYLKTGEIFLNEPNQFGYTHIVSPSKEMLEESKRIKAEESRTDRHLENEQRSIEHIELSNEMDIDDIINNPQRRSMDLAAYRDSNKEIERETPLD